jgi:ribosomal-protein-alanine N-acetyltransferase
MTLPMTYAIETERCRLRIVSAEDIPHVFSASRFPGFNDGMVWEAPHTIEELEAPHRKSILKWKRGEAYTFTIEAKDTAVFIGRIGLRAETEANVWSVGFWTHPDKQGHGFASEALRAIVDLAFSQLDAVSVEGCHALWNVASRRVFEKAGMTFSRHVPEGFRKNGSWVPEDCFSTDRNQWMKHRAGI